MTVVKRLSDRDPAPTAPDTFLVEVEVALSRSRNASTRELRHQVPAKPRPRSETRPGYSTRSSAANCPVGRLRPRWRFGTRSSGDATGVGCSQPGAGPLFGNVATWQASFPRVRAWGIL